MKYESMNSTACDYNLPMHKRSRTAYTFECAFEYFVALLVTETFLAKLLSSIGIRDSVIGIISSFISLSFIFQLFSVLVVGQITNTKKFSILVHCVSQLFFSFLYVVPFLPFAYAGKEVLVVICILVAYFGKYLVTAMIFAWGNSHVDPKHRAEYGAGKEMVSLILGMIVTLITGYAMDVFEASDNMEGGFVFAAVAIFIFTVCDFVCLMLMKQNVQKEVVSREPVGKVLKIILGNRDFRNLLVLQILWNVAQYTTIGFMGTYYLNPDELAYTVGAVQLINIGGNFARFLMSKPFGRYSDKHSFARGIELGLIIAVAAFGINAFTSPTAKYLVIAYVVLYNICLAGVNQNLLNITYQYVDERYFVQATALKNSIGGICGFCASVLAGLLLQKIQEHGNSFLGLPLYGQQVLSLISCVILFVALLFTRRAIVSEKALGE